MSSRQYPPGKYADKKSNKEALPEWRLTCEGSSRDSRAGNESHKSDHGTFRNKAEVVSQTGPEIGNFIRGAEFAQQNGSDNVSTSGKESIQGKISKPKSKLSHSSRTKLVDEYSELNSTDSDDNFTLRSDKTNSQSAQSVKRTRKVNVASKDAVSTRETTFLMQEIFPNPFEEHEIQKLLIKERLKKEKRSSKNKKNSSTTEDEDEEGDDDDYEDDEFEGRESQLTFITSDNHLNPKGSNKENDHLERNEGKSHYRFFVNTSKNHDFPLMLALMHMKNEKSVLRSKESICEIIPTSTEEHLKKLETAVSATMKIDRSDLPSSFLLTKSESSNARSKQTKKENTTTGSISFTLQSLDETKNVDKDWFTIIKSGKSQQGKRRRSLKSKKKASEKDLTKRKVVYQSSIKRTQFHPENFKTNLEQGFGTKSNLKRKSSLSESSKWQVDEKSKAGNSSSSKKDRKNCRRKESTVHCCSNSEKAPESSQSENNTSANTSLDQLYKKNIENKTETSIVLDDEINSEMSEIPDSEKDYLEMTNLDDLEQSADAQSKINNVIDSAIEKIDESSSHTTDLKQTEASSDNGSDCTGKVGRKEFEDLQAIMKMINDEILQKERSEVEEINDLTGNWVFQTPFPEDIEDLGATSLESNDIPQTFGHLSERQVSGNDSQSPTESAYQENFSNPQIVRASYNAEIPEFDASLGNYVLQSPEGQNELGSYAETLNERNIEAGETARFSPLMTPERRSVIYSIRNRRKRETLMNRPNNVEEVKTALDQEISLARETLEHRLESTENILSKLEDFITNDDSSCLKTSLSLMIDLEKSLLSTSDEKISSECFDVTEQERDSIELKPIKASSILLPLDNEKACDRIMALEIAWGLMLPKYCEVFVLRTHESFIWQVNKSTSIFVAIPEVSLSQLCITPESKSIKGFKESECCLSIISMPEKTSSSDFSSDCTENTGQKVSLHPEESFHCMSIPLDDYNLNQVNISCEILSKGQEPKKHNIIMFFSNNDESSDAQTPDCIESEDKRKMLPRCEIPKDNSSNKEEEESQSKCELFYANGFHDANALSQGKGRIPLEQNKIDELLSRTYKIQHRLESYSQSTSPTPSLMLQKNVSIEKINAKLAETSLTDVNASSESDTPLNVDSNKPQLSPLTVRKDSKTLLRNSKQKAESWSNKHVKFDSTGPVVFWYLGSQNSNSSVEGDVKNGSPQEKSYKVEKKEQAPLYSQWSKVSLKDREKNCNDVLGPPTSHMIRKPGVGKTRNDLTEKESFCDIGCYTKDEPTQTNLGSDPDEPEISSSLSSFKSSNEFSDASDFSDSGSNDRKSSSKDRKISFLNKLFRQLEFFKKDVLKKTKKKCVLKPKTSIEKVVVENIHPENPPPDETPTLPPMEPPKAEEEQKIVSAQEPRELVVNTELSRKRPMTIDTKILKTIFKGKESTTELMIDLKDLGVSEINDISVEKQKLSSDHTKVSVFISKPNIQDIHRSAIYARRYDTILESNSDLRYQKKYPNDFYHNQIFSTPATSLNRLQDSAIEEPPTKSFISDPNERSDKSDRSNTSDKSEASNTEEKTQESSDDEEEFESAGSSINDEKTNEDVQKSDVQKKRCKYTNVHDSKAEIHRKPAPPRHQFDFYRKFNADLNLRSKNSRPKNLLFDSSHLSTPKKEFEPIKKALTDMQLRVRNIQRQAEYSSENYYERALRLAKLSEGYCTTCGNRSLIPEDPFGYYKNLVPRFGQTPPYSVKNNSATNSNYYSVRSSSTDMNEVCRSPSYLTNDMTSNTGAIFRNSSNTVPLSLGRRF